MTCPQNSIRYNTSLCACLPGHLLNYTTNVCTLFGPKSDVWTDLGINSYTLSFPETIFDFDQIKKFTQSQAVFLEATLVMLLTWLVFCFSLRFMKLADGKNVWFKIRWCISRLDFCFATRHWLEDQKVVRKRKTELGGTFSIASWILFIGLFSALLYQVISKRSIEVHNIRPTNAPDIAAFINDMEFNITTISNMSCLNLHGLGTLAVGNPGFINHKVISLSKFVNYSCLNTSIGPMVSLKCDSCRLLGDNLYISWQFVDQPNNPAVAVGYQFNFTTRDHNEKKHVASVGGLMKNGSMMGDQPVTFRGRDANILKFNLFPRIYNSLGDLRIVQPLFHEFLPGSYMVERDQLRASLESSVNGLINTTVYVDFLSSYIVEIDQENIMGPVSFLADLGGLYCFCIAIFFYLMVQCEYRVKKLRNEGKILRSIRNKRKAQEHWNKLRKYVKYTWGVKGLEEDDINIDTGSSCNCLMVKTGNGSGSYSGNTSSQKQKPYRLDSIELNEMLGLPSEKKATPQDTHIKGDETCSLKTAAKTEGRLSTTKYKLQPQKVEVLSFTTNGYQIGGSCNEDMLKPSKSEIDDDFIPAPPSLEMKTNSNMDLSDINKNLQSLYEYNVMLREKLAATQSQLRSLAAKSSSPDSNI